MPELPEVETVCRIMRSALIGQKIVNVIVPEDEIVLGGTPSQAFQEVLIGKTVTSVGRKGKFWWFEMPEGPWLMGHLGMSGWIRALGGTSIRLQSHGNATLDSPDGTPKFLKLLIETESCARIAFTDGRRLGRLWLAESAAQDRRIQKLGFDVLDELPETDTLAAILSKRKVSIKGVLLDQAIFAGVGNWIADEVLFQSGIAPHRLSSTLSLVEVDRLRSAIQSVVSFAVEVGADSAQYPDTWLFNSRWGGSKGADQLQGLEIVRETIAGRTTAWVPSVQS